MADRVTYFSNVALDDPPWETVILAGTVGGVTFRAPAEAWTRSMPPLAEARHAIQCLAEGKLHIVCFKDGDSLTRA